MGKKIFTVRVIIMLVALALFILAINPNPFVKGIEVKSVHGDAAENGLKQGDSIIIFNDKQVNTAQEFNILLLESFGNETVYKINTDRGEIAFISSEKLDIVVNEKEKSNIEKGLDLEGGVRALLRPVSEEKVTDNQINNLIDVLSTRLDTYGLSDIVLRRAQDRNGENLVLVEIAGATREEVKDLIEGQGVFEAKIGNETVFFGGEKDITYVCKDDGSCSGVSECVDVEDGTSRCSFQFLINLKPEAAKKHAEITKGLGVISSSDGNYLEEQLDLFLDGVLVDSLNIHENLKGVEATQITISGPGIGNSRETAYQDALNSMNKLQTVLITGSLPFKLEIEKLDSISPLLGEEFVRNTFIVGLISLLSVGIVVFLKYRKLKIVIPIMITLVVEVIMTLGFAALIKWRLDLVSIAGIIAVVGTGVNDQIVIVDEVLKGGAQAFNWKQRIKRAFSIILGAYATIFVAMLPLWGAGAGLIRGFAVTTIIGMTIGILITRPAFASLIERLLSE